jgi:hypothetical protein
MGRPAVQAAAVEYKVLYTSILKILLAALALLDKAILEEVHLAVVILRLGPVAVEVLPASADKVH